MWSAQYNVTCYLANHRLVSQRCHINFSGLNQIYWDKYTKPNLQNRIYKIKSTRQNVQNVENQIYWTEYTQLNLFNQTFFKSAQLILPNQIYRKLKQSTIPAWDLLGPACSIFRSVGISRSANFTHRQTDKLILSFFMTVYAFTFAMYDYCHNPNSTSTQLNSWVWHENDFRPPPTTTHHHKLNVINISAVPDPILTKL